MPKPGPSLEDKPASWAARLLPASLSRRSGGRASESGSGSHPAQAPERVLVPVHLLSGQEAALECPADSSLDELQLGCRKATGVPPALQSLVVQEEPLPGGLRSLGSSLGNQHHLKRQLEDWSTFLLLPEGLRRELRGQGLASWLKQHVWEPLQEPRQAPPGTAWVTVALLTGTRRPILLHSATTLRQLRREVQEHTGLPAGQQRLVVVQQREPGRVLCMLRMLLTVLVMLGSWLVAALRRALGVPPSSEVHMRLQTESGRQVELALSPDTTLREMQRMVWERHGEQLSLGQHLCLTRSPSPSPSRSSSPGRGSRWAGSLTKAWSGGGGGGGEGATCEDDGQGETAGSGSPAKRQLHL